MKKIVNIFLFIIFNFLVVACSEDYQERLSNSVWKNCGESATPDLLDFRYQSLIIKNDTIFSKNNDSAIAIIDKIEFYYGEQRLYIRDFKNNVGRYCEK